MGKKRKGAALMDLIMGNPKCLLPYYGTKYVTISVKKGPRRAGCSGEWVNG